MMIDHSLIDHPYAACYPLISGPLELSLLESIREHGLRQPIVLWDDHERETTWIVDGRNRYRALMEIQGGVKKDQVVWKHFVDDEEARLAVLDYNENRRQMTTAQKSVVAGRILQARESLEGVIFVESLPNDSSSSPSTEGDDQLLEKKRVGDLQASEGVHLDQNALEPIDSKEIKEQEKAKRKSKRLANRIRKQVASTLGIGPQAAQKGAHVVHRAVPELIHALEQGDLSLEAAYTLTRLEDDEIQTLISEGKDSIRTKVRSIKQKEKEATQSESDEIVESTPRLKDQKILTFDHLPAQSAEMRLTLAFTEEGHEVKSCVDLTDPQIRQSVLQSLLKLGILAFSQET